MISKKSQNEDCLPLCIMVVFADCEVSIRVLNPDRELSDEDSWKVAEVTLQTNLFANFSDYATSSQYDGKTAPPNRLICKALTNC